MPQARAARFVAENKDRSAGIDVVLIESESGDAHISYDAFQEIFGLTIAPGRDICFEIMAKQISEESCTVPR